jgi:hypothetical protein
VLQGPVVIPNGGGSYTGVGGGGAYIKPRAIFQPATGTAATGSANPTQIPTTGGTVAWNPLAGASQSSGGTSGMNWRAIIILGALFFGVYAFGQSDNTVHVKSFPGSTVGAKVAAAQVTCNPDANIPCILVIDASLKATAGGTMPTLCAQCSLQDFRGGMGKMLKVESFPGDTIDVQIESCLAAIPSGGVCDARGFGATTQRTAGSSTVGANQRVIFDVATKVQPASASATVVIAQPGSEVDNLNVDLSPYAATYTGTVISSVCTSGGPGKGPVILNENVSGANGATGNALSFSCGTANWGVAYSLVDGITSTGLLNPIVFSTTASGAWINANTIKNATLVGVSTAAIKCISLSNAGLEIRGNVFSGNCEGNSGVGSTGIYLANPTGTSPVQANEFMLNTFDVTNNWQVGTGSVVKNFLMGNLEGSTLDNGLNTIVSLLAGTQQFGFTDSTFTSPTDTHVIVNEQSTGHQALIKFNSAGVTKWELGKDIDNTFFLFDDANAKDAIYCALPGVCVIGENGQPTQVPYSLEIGANTVLPHAVVGYTGSDGTKVVLATTPTAGKASCWTSTGRAGYCSTQPDATGSCTCN